MEAKKYLLHVLLIHLVRFCREVSSDEVLPVTLTNPQFNYTLEYPGYPGDGAPSTSTTWSVTGPSESRIQLICSSIVLLKRAGCSEGVLSVADSRDKVDICSVTKSYRRQSIGNLLTVHFKTGSLGMGRIDCVARLLETDEGTSGGGDLDGSDSGAKLTSCPCSRTNEVNKKRIIWGKVTGANEFSFMAYISYGIGKPLQCGGSIVTKRHILTAAHCVTVTLRCFLKVFVGVHNIEEVEHNEWVQKLNVRKTYTHKDYSKTKMVNDIGLLVVSEDIRFNQFVGPVCLPTEPYSLIDQEVKVLGWGRTSRKGADSEALRSTDLTVVPLKKCMDHYNMTLSPTTQLCIYTFGKNACKGDSGGPVLHMDSELGRWVQVALISFGSDDSNKAEVTTLILPFFDWIQSIIEQSSTQRMGSSTPASGSDQSGTKEYSETFNTCEKLEQSLQ